MIAITIIANITIALIIISVVQPEIGIPFSDPMADGPVIQAAATRALRNGMTLRKLFAHLKGIRDDGKHSINYKF